MSNAQTLFDQLTGAGLGKAGALGVVGNVLAESGANPTATGDGGTSHGLAQWHLTRWDQFLAWAKNLGKNPNSFDTQSAYLVQDLQSYNGGSLWRQLKATQDTYAASNLVMTQYERPANQSTAEAQRRGDLGTMAILQSKVDQIPATLGPSTASQAVQSLTGALDWKSWGVTALFLAAGLGVATAGVIKLASPKLQQATAVAAKAAMV